MSITKIYRKDNQPFAQIPNEAIRDPRITANAFRLLAYLMSHQDGYEVTYEQIERQTALGRFAINQAANNLTSLGWLAVERTKAANGQYGPKSWTVLTPTSTTVGYSTVESPHMEPPTDIRRTPSIEDKELRIVNPQPAVEEAFLEFWSVYPRKVEKIAALKAFGKAVAAVGVDAVLDGVKRLAADPNLPPKQFIPYPASWLNAGGWESEPYPEREKTAEEKQALQQAINERKRNAEAEASRRLKEEMAEAKRRAEENPPERCEHDRIKVLCPKCRTH